MSDIQRKGWCPGALAPMASGDGLIVRIRTRLATLTCQQICEIADLARNFGNGQIDLTQRAHIQLRGVTEKTLSPLLERLALTGLLDDDVGTETIRNIIISPFSKQDPLAEFDITPQARALEQALAVEPALHRLPAKFGFVIDSGGWFDLDQAAGDIGFRAIRSERYAVRLAGLGWVGSCQRSDMARLAVRLAGRCLEHGQDVEARMHAVIQSYGVGSFADCGLEPLLDPPSLRSNALKSGCTKDFLLLGAPFGRIHAKQFFALARALEESCIEIAMTPWRALAIHGLKAQEVDDLLKDMAVSGWITAPDDSRLKIAVCPGMPECASAVHATRPDAQRIAEWTKMRPDLFWHISGCKKGCAQSSPVPITLVAQANLTYDVIFNGKASDPPAAQALTLEQIWAIATQIPKKT